MQGEECNYKVDFRHTSGCLSTEGRGHTMFLLTLQRGGTQYQAKIKLTKPDYQFVISEQSIQRVIDFEGGQG